MIIERHNTAEKINEIVNHPSVYPWVCGNITGPLDLTEVVANERNVALFCDLGGVLFFQHQPGLYEAHTQVLPEARGVGTLDIVRQALRWMFTKTDAVEIVTRVPHGNGAAQALVKAIKGVYEFTNQKGWVKDGEPIPADVYGLRLQDWLRDDPEIEARGHWFHERLEAEYARHNTELKVHEDDVTHDRYAGAAVEMIMNGQINKGVIFYNRWAVMAGYEPIKALSYDPVIVDIKDAVLMLKGDTFEVILCR